MTPKEKAQELFDKYFDQMLSFGFHLSNRQISKIALIAVDEILSELAYTQNYVEDAMNKIQVYISYWQEVKKEIENL